MTAHSYECLLVAADLAVFHKSWGFTIKILQWKKFLEGHHFITSNSIGSFEVDTKKIDLHAFIHGTKPTKDRFKIQLRRHPAWRRWRQLGVSAALAAAAQSTIN